MYIERVNHTVIEASIDRSFITTVLGPRRVGKSYFMEHMIKRHPDRLWVSLNMDKMDQRNRIKDMQLETMIVEHAKQHIAEGNKIWVIIDEAQKCPELFDQIKILYDEYKNQNKIKFILTGSALLSLHQLCSESLAGRVEIYHFYEFNLHEYTSLYESALPRSSLFDILPLDNSDTDEISKHIHQLSPFKPILEEKLKEYLLWGGFPELFSLKTNEKMIYLNNYLETYLEKDVRAIETITDLELYRNMMDVIAEQTGSVRDDQRFINALQCTRDTLKKYRGFLEATLLYQDIYPYIGSSLKRLQKSPKGYLLNNGLVSVLTGIADLSILEKTGLIGHRLENWFLNEIHVWNAREPMRSHVNFWRTSSGIEVDFVVVRKPHVFPFEVTYGASVDRKKIRNLSIFLSEEPSIQWGYYVYNGEFTIDKKNKIIFLPVWAVS